MITPREMAELAVKTLDNKKARDIKLLETTAITSIADYFVICTAGSAAQIKMLADEVEHQLESAGEQLHHREGYRDGGWVLIDFGCVIVHIFLEEMRQFYNLERLWTDSEDIDLSVLLSPQ